MTAHPLELIAEMDDLDLDQKDLVARHVARCDTCRSVERAMQRMDGLIAMPEPALPLPKLATPRGGVRVAGWAFAFAVVVTLVATMAVLVGSSRQTSVAGTDACGVLTAAARSAGVVAASAKASAIELPPSLAGSWTACGYGGGPLVLFRSEPTAAWEVRALLEGLLSPDQPPRVGFGGSFVPDPCSGDALTERWVVADGTCGSDMSPAMAVAADPYFFVVAGPATPHTTRRLADAILAELRQRPWPPLSEASKIDACNVIARAAPAGGIPAAQSVRFPVIRHWAELYPSDPRMWSNTACAFHDHLGFDEHLGIREVSAPVQEPNDLLVRVSGSLTPSTVDDWVQIEPGMWLAHAQTLNCPGCVRPNFSVVAVLDEPHFFALTQETDETAIRLARAVLAELKRP